MNIDTIKKYFRARGLVYPDWRSALLFMLSEVGEVITDPTELGDIYMMFKIVEDQLNVDADYLLSLKMKSKSENFTRTANVLNTMNVSYSQIVMLMIEAFGKLCDAIVNNSAWVRNNDKERDVLKALDELEEVLSALRRLYTNE